MNILIVYAHPEPRSLNGALKDFAVQHLQNNGHTVQVSDLYAMKWKSELDIQDFPAFDTSTPFNPAAESKHAFAERAQTADVVAEQEKLIWADAVIFQFPLWWFSMPAILKGWFDRVYAYGLAYGVGEHSDKHWGDRYGEGSFKGKRAMLSVTTGGWESHYSERGINGSINDLLFPIQHGALFYPGFDVLLPFLLYRVTQINEENFNSVESAFATRLDGIFTEKPIPFRRQNFGDYDIPALTLKEGLEIENVTGFSLHLQK